MEPAGATAQMGQPGEYSPRMCLYFPSTFHIYGLHSVYLCTMDFHPQNWKEMLRQGQGHTTSETGPSAHLVHANLDIPFKTVPFAHS